VLKTFVVYEEEEKEGGERRRRMRGVGKGDGGGERRGGEGEGAWTASLSSVMAQIYLLHIPTQFSH